MKKIITWKRIILVFLLIYSINFYIGVIKQQNIEEQQIKQQMEQNIKQQKLMEERIDKSLEWISGESTDEEILDALNKIPIGKEYKSDKSDKKIYDNSKLPRLTPENIDSISDEELSKYLD